MGTSSRSHFHQQPSPKMLPSCQQPRGLQTSLSLVSLDACGSPNLQEHGSNSDQEQVVLYIERNFSLQKRLSQASLIEVFLYKRCRNIACGSPLPAEDCNYEACSMRNGFCNLCMCVICNKFDFEVNTCRWISCDLCSHWTHTDCAIRNGLIGPGPSVKTGSVPADMLTSPPMNLG
ncbi:OBERON-like protein [Camellia lanceoleosa]|uniref:OBERON-like protein n=1 Tax=Camellia lanceoleosa TaxID=1840588 RepID=A0ACC0J088_9ERIC|nr:OBERON-like protein [Camellia lanceoleosa]